MKVTRYVDDLKQKFKFSLLVASSKVWRNPLDRDASIKILEDAIVYQKSYEPVTMPGLKSLTSVDARWLVNDFTVNFDKYYIWQVGMNDRIRSLSICSSGTVLINDKSMLDLDYGNASGLLDLPYKLKQVKYPIVIAPWSHFWGGYYDFIIGILSKLCRIEKVFGQGIWQEVKICYPLRNTHYEKEYLQKLGIPETSLIDTRNWQEKIQAESAILGNNMRTIITPDIVDLRNRFCPLQKCEAKRKIYISRAGKRRVKNEIEVKEVLQQFGFEILEDISRPVDEQIRIFQEAAVVVGPHGAGFTNLLWCQPGTKVIEFFNGGYTPPYFYYISQILGLDYSYMVEPTSDPEHWSLEAYHMTVDTEVLKRELKKMLD
ncbi:MAG: glycosyltransferase family 61 protein [Microcoleus sp.]